MNGYGPKTVSSHSATSVVRSIEARAAPAWAPRSLLYALRTGRPFAVRSVVMSNFPTASVARYVACGLSERQLKRVRPSDVDCDCSTPLLMAW